MNHLSSAQSARRLPAAPVYKPLVVAVALALAVPHAVLGAPLPVGEHNMTGVASVARPTGTSMVVTQNAPAAIINWGDFSIDVGASVKFVQPNNGVILNRVDASGGNTFIDGSMTANGRVFIVNERGVFFWRQCGGQRRRPGRIDAEDRRCRLYQRTLCLFGQRLGRCRQLPAA